MVSAFLAIWCGLMLSADSSSGREVSNSSSMLTVPCGRVLVRSDPGFANATSIDNESAAKNRLPALVVMCACPGDVAAAMMFAQQTHIGFAVKGAGHSAAGYSLIKDGVVADMSLMNSSRFVNDTAPGAVPGVPAYKVEAGAFFGQLYSRLNGTGLLLVGGGCSGVGIAGFTLGGGLSFLSRAFGLGSDSLLSLTMVLANGTILDVSPSVTPDLWWALRGGGGGNFGVVTSLTMRLHHVSQSAVSEVCWHGNDVAAEALPQYAKWLESSRVDQSIGAPALLLRMKYPVSTTVSLCVTLFAVNQVNVDEQVASLISFVKTSAAPEIPNDGCGGNYTINHPSFYEWESRCGTSATGVNHDDGYMTSGVLKAGALDSEAAALALVNALATAPGERTIINFHDGGGKIRMPVDGGGSFPHRSFNLIYQVKSIWEPKDGAKVKNMNWALQLSNALKSVRSGAYVNYIDPLLSNWTNAYYRDSYDRLVAIKKSVDPTNFFNFNQSIGAVYETRSTPKAWTAPQPAKCSGLMSLMDRFQDGQNKMDAAGLASLYTLNGTNSIPVSSGVTAMGRTDIETDFANYFASLAFINETIRAPVLITNNFGAFAKTIESATKENPDEHIREQVINWFEYDCSTTPPLISTFSAIFNGSTSCQGLTQQMLRFQEGQNKMDAIGLASLYTLNGTNSIPVSSGVTASGRTGIETDFANYFATLNSIHETTIQPVITNGNFGAFVKRIETSTKRDPNVTISETVVNWFNFDCSTTPPLISSFAALFDKESSV